MRLLVEALRFSPRAATGGGAAGGARQLAVTVFVSDFHAARTKACLEWALALGPPAPPAPRVALAVRSVPSDGEDWGASRDAFARRLEHERAATAAARENARLVRSGRDMLAYLLLGGHRGYWDYTHGRYTPSEGAGWGGVAQPGGVS